MRTIKFRGKDKRSGEWYYGNLYDKDTRGRTHICTTTRGSLDVKPETVGQFTGFHDDAGKEIYEGDIVKASCLNRTELAEIRWFNGCFCMITEDWFETLYGFDADALEVVGNIHDNPELLKAK